MTTTNRFVWGLIGLIILAGISFIAFSLGQIVSPAPLPATATPLPVPAVTVGSLKTQAKFSTIDMKAVTEVYQENVPDGWLDSTLGRKEKLLMLVYGNVSAGFDLQKMTEANLWTDGKKVRLALPPPEILNSSLDFEHTHIVYYENSMLLDNNNPNLQGEALAQAQKALEQAAIENGLLDQASTQGKLYFENFLYSLGFTEVEVVVNAQLVQE